MGLTGQGRPKKMCPADINKIPITIFRYIYIFCLLFVHHFVLALLLNNLNFNLIDARMENAAETVDFSSI